MPLYTNIILSGDTKYIEWKCNYDSTYRQRIY